MQPEEIIRIINGNPKISLGRLAAITGWNVLELEILASDVG